MGSRTGVRLIKRLVILMVVVTVKTVKEKNLLPICIVVHEGIDHIKGSRGEPLEKQHPGEVIEQLNF